MGLTTNGYLRATVHRVVTPPAGVERFSVPFFFSAQLDATIPLLDLPEELAAEARGPASDPDNPLFRDVGVNVLKSRLLHWSKQIEAAVSDDQQKPFSTGDHDLAVARMTGSFWLRHKFLTSWVDCYRTGTGVDADRDGHVWCRDCNDGAAGQHPGAAEICGNDVDENCNGRKDDCP